MARRIRRRALSIYSLVLFGMLWLLSTSVGAASPVKSDDKQIVVMYGPPPIISGCWCNDEPVVMYGPAAMR